MAVERGGLAGHAVQPGHGERVGGQENVVVEIEVARLFIVDVHL